MEPPGGLARGGVVGGCVAGWERDRGPILKDTSNTESRHSEPSPVAAANILNTFNIHVDVVITGVPLPTALQTTSPTNLKFYISVRCAELCIHTPKLDIHCAPASHVKRHRQNAPWHLRIISDYRLGALVNSSYLKFVSLGTPEFQVASEFFT